MTQQDLEKIFLSKKGAVKEFPFDDVTAVFKVCNKMFGLIRTEQNPLQVNLKCLPEDAIVFRDMYDCVEEGYHMNKKHWNTITLNGCLSNETLEEMIEDSYNLIVSKLTKRERKTISLATFAAGCFWGTEAIYRGKKGILNTSVGFMGGHYKNPTYDDVMTNTTGHAEVAQIEYDEKQISYNTLLAMFFKSHNPTSIAGEKSKYRTTIFYHTMEQKELAENFIQALRDSDRFVEKIKTTVVKASEFYLAEESHQQYYEKKHKL